MIASNYDGGYVLLNDFENIKIAYSIGIDMEVTLDKVLVDKRLEVYMYDHTIESLPEQNPRFH